MIAIIKIENNLQEVLQYLEELGFTWSFHSKPTVITEIIENSCKTIYVYENVITWSQSLPPTKAVTFKEFKQRFLNGIMLEPGMSFEDDKKNITVVIPHKSHGIAFISYTYANNWYSGLTPSRKKAIKTIYDIPSGGAITGTILWKAPEISLDGESISKEELIEKIKHFEGDIKVEFN